jgi:acetylornithine deacetylase/succinyl-diaminopimelate desuccinylase-like protein
VEGRQRVTDPDPTDVEALLEHLVGIDSQNPDLAPGSPGEGALAGEVARILTGLGLEARTHDTLEGRPNVVGVLPGTTGQALLLEAHLDTVPAPPGPLVVRRERRRLYGRGSCDTKGSLAAMIAAVGRLAGQPGPRPTVVIAGVVDEEYIMRGAAKLIDHIPEVAGVVIGEPTSLVPVRAHNGFIRVRVHADGHSVHSSKADLGHNAILTSARLLTALETSLGKRLRQRRHPLTGPALLTPTMTSGGIAPNIVPDHCEVWFDRRLAPGEAPHSALAEIDKVLDRLRAEGDTIRRDEPIVVLPGLETPEDHPLVRATEQAVEAVSGSRRRSEGVTYSTDACYLGGQGGLPCVVMGPGSINQAHTVDEWIDLDEVVLAVDIYAELVMQFGRASVASQR